MSAKEDRIVMLDSHRAMERSPDFRSTSIARSSRSKCLGCRRSYRTA